jgi:hypothetical protein
LNRKSEEQDVALSNAQLPLSAIVFPLDSTQLDPDNDPEQDINSVVIAEHVHTSTPDTPAVDSLSMPSGHVDSSPSIPSSSTSFDCTQYEKSFEQSWQLKYVL